MDEQEVKELRRWLTSIDRRLAHLSLERASGGRNDPPGKWGDSVRRLLQLTREFADRIADDVGHDQLLTPLENAESLILSEIAQRRGPR